MTARERLLACLRAQRVDRPPVICPGGMMTMATTSAMRAGGACWPAAHSDARAMADLVVATQQETGLECLAVPFCMTVEAEALGCRVDLGTDTILPHVAAEAIAGWSDLEHLPTFDPDSCGRAPVVLDALRMLAGLHTPYPVIGAVVGPVSLAAMVMDTGVFLRLTRRAPEAAQALVDRMARVTIDFALAQRAAGADCVMIAEPSATGELLGGKHFARLALPALSRALGVLRRQATPVILHICGDVRPILAELRQLASSLSAPLALSVDSIVSGRILRAELAQCAGAPAAVRVGNVDAFLLQRGPLSAIRRAARIAAREFDVVSPACGLVPVTPARNLRELVETVQHGQDSPQD